VESGISFTPIPNCDFIADPYTCSIQTDFLSNVSTSSNRAPSVYLVMEDELGLRTNLEVRSYVQTVGTNPVCRNVALDAEPGSPLRLDPATYLMSDGNPICKDGDLNPLTYQIRRNPDYGVAWADPAPAAGLTYLPFSGFTGLDDMAFRANDGTTNSSDAEIRINVQGTPPEDWDCISGALTIPPTTFTPGTYNLAYTTSISTQGAVIIQSGADVTFRAPTLSLQPGFKVASGAKFEAISGAAACSPPSP
jgi:hypothetical protein